LAQITDTIDDGAALRRQNHAGVTASRKNPQLDESG